MSNKQSIGKYIDKINKETIDCRESVLPKNFQSHANKMMKGAYQVDYLVHKNDYKFTYYTVRQLKNYIKQLQHPIIKIDKAISNETYSEITYVLYCLGDLVDELEL